MRFRMPFVLNIRTKMNDYRENNALTKCSTPGKNAMENSNRYVKRRTSAFVLNILLPHSAPVVAFSQTKYETKALDCRHNAHQDKQNKAAIMKPAKPVGISLIALEGNNIERSCMCIGKTETLPL